MDIKKRMCIDLEYDCAIIQVLDKIRDTVYNIGMKLFVWPALKEHELCVSCVILLCV
jgi:hypothetical protein